MDVEIELGRGWWWVIASMAVLALLGLVLLGRAVTPEGGGLLTLEAWKLLRENHAYDAELSTLQQNADELASLLNERPDPVRAALAADRIQQSALDGHPALALQREALSHAAEEVRIWAVGGGAREDAEVALIEAGRLVKQGTER
ncbi:MAG: hypothetical protein GTO18_06415 [Anaerolineales bacterium]|nr:hypothetical protein [Anaerolineales bacterium]